MHGLMEGGQEEERSHGVAICQGSHAFKVEYILVFMLFIYLFIYFDFKIGPYLK